MNAVNKPLTISPDEMAFMIETVSGRHVNPTNPNEESIHLEDIAWSLSRIPRFAGHTITEVSYNVAQHSVYVSELLEQFIRNPQTLFDIQNVPDNIFDIADSLSKSHIPPVVVDEFLLSGLLHDAHEAYLGDIASPIKRIPELRPTIKLLEGKLDHAINSHFKLQELSEPEKAFVKFADNMAQAIEGYQFMPSRGLNWDLPKPSLVSLQQFPAPLAPLESYKKFIERFNYLKNQ